MPSGDWAERGLLGPVPQVNRPVPAGGDCRVPEIRCGPVVLHVGERDVRRVIEDRFAAAIGDEVAPGSVGAAYGPVRPVNRLGWRVAREYPVRTEINPGRPYRGTSPASFHALCVDNDRADGGGCRQPGREGGSR